MQRGVPSSLVIVELPSSDNFSSDHPAPVLSYSSIGFPVAEMYVSGKGIILHTDSAKAYMKEFPRMAHTRVRG